VYSMSSGSYVPEPVPAVGLPGIHALSGSDRLDLL
jgi:hypothetical protein